MAVETPRRPEEEIHGEAEDKPLFGPNNGSGNGDADSPYINQSQATDLGGHPVHDKKPLTPNELKAAENNSKPGAQTAGGKAEKAGLGYRTGDSGGGSLRDMVSNRLGAATSFMRNNKKKTAGGLIAGGVVGGAMFSFSIIQGPLQIIHLSQVLQKYHFLSQSDATDNRYGK